MLDTISNVWALNFKNIHIQKNVHVRIELPVSLKKRLHLRTCLLGKIKLAVVILNSNLVGRIILPLT